MNDASLRLIDHKYDQHQQSVFYSLHHKHIELITAGKQVQLGSKRRPGLSAANEAFEKEPFVIGGGSGASNVRVSRSRLLQTKWTLEITKRMAQGLTETADPTVEASVDVPHEVAA